MRARLLAVVLFVLWVAGCDPGLDDGAIEGEGDSAAVSRADVSEAVHWDESPPLHLMAGASEVKEVDIAAFGAPIVNFDGLSVGNPPGIAPGDPSGDVGPNHYFQVVNLAFRISSKTGTTLVGPLATNTLWAGFGGVCETQNFGYASVRYDRLADRWIVTQPANAGLVAPFLQCIAVSTTGDPTGSYYRYAFQYTSYNDIPRIAVWPEAYFFTYNMFTPPSFPYAGAKVCAVERTKMLAGLPARQLCYDTSTTYAFLLAADFEGGTLPAAGAPVAVLALGSQDVTDDELAYWSFGIDWGIDPPSGTFTGPISIPVAPYTRLCNGAVNCVPQAGTATLLSGMDRGLMSRVGYRRFAGHESLVATHSVLLAAGSGGKRWYELRDPTTSGATLHQQGDVGAINSYRWMGAIAMDKLGGIGLGYSLSSTSIFPAIAYSGRAAADPLGTMPQAEQVLMNGLGAQTSPNRWGDWSMMSVDPVDDCTFWFTAQYPGLTGGFNWRTRIGSFQVSNCVTDLPPSTAITSPTSGALLAGVVPIQASATDDYGISKVEFRKNGILLGTDVAAPYQLDWDTTTVADGAHTLRSRAYDSIDQFTNSAAVNVTVDNPGGPDLTPPTTWLHLPANGSTVSGTIKVAAKAIDAVGVDRVEFYRGAVLLGTDLAGPYVLNWNTSSVPDGSYNLTSKAFDAAGNFAVSAPVAITVHNDLVTTSLLFNGGFESGAFAPRWSASGPVQVVTSPVKTGGNAARIGSTSAVAGDASIGQTFTVPTTGVTTLRFWYQLHCEFDSVEYDQQEALLLDPGGAEVGILFRTCEYQPTWTQKIVDLTPYAGQTLTLVFKTHDDGYVFDPSWFYVDAITVKNVY